jgi:hypothetical protein
MKRCKKCNQEKLISEFSIRSASKDSLQTYCKICAVELRMESYHKNYDRERKYRYDKSRENAQKLKEYKESLPCKDCDRFYPSYVMDFDHTSDDKENNVGSLIKSTWARILREIEKCELVCSNCHRVRTHNRLP